MRLRADQIPSHLKRNELAPIYLFSGDEPLQLSEGIDSIRTAARHQAYEDRIVLDVDKSFDWNRLLQENASMSLFSTKKIIELRLGTHKPGRDGGAALIEYAEQCSVDNLLIISCARLDKKNQQTKWYKALDKAGVTITIWPIETGQLSGWIQQRFKQQGKQIDLPAAEIIAQRVEGNLLAANQEINKLCLLVSTNKVTLEDVTHAVVDSARYDVFAMMEAAFQGDLARTVRMLTGFRNEGVEPMAIYGAMMWNIRQAATIATQMETGSSLDQALSSQWGMSTQRKFALKKLLTRHSGKAIQSCLVTAGKIDRVIKGDKRPLTWSCFHELMKSIVSDSSVEARLINSLTA